MTVGWLQMDITYDEATSDYEFAPVFNEDEDQTRWFYFQSNGKKVKADGAREAKEKTINGKKYAFDQYGAMVAEWSLDIAKATSNLGTNSTAACLLYTSLRCPNLYIAANMSALNVSKTI